VAAILIPPPGIYNNSQPGSFANFGAFLPDQRPGAPVDIRRIEFNTEISNTVVPGLQTLLMVVQPLRPNATGTVNIQDQDPLKIASVQTNLLNDDDDYNLTATFFVNVVAPMVANLTAAGYYLIDPPSQATYTTPSLLKSFIQSSLGNTHHYQCFNRLGQNIQTSVVDDWGLVHGTNNLWAIDDGMPPVATDGNTGGTAMMLGYRCGKHLAGLI
jgi:choline dehydrogenase-like flavoprotein